MIKSGWWHRSLRVQLIFIFVACLFVSVLLQVGLNYITRDFRKVPFTSYESSKNRVNEKTALIERELEAVHDPVEAGALLNKYSERSLLQLYLVDLEGKVIFHSEAASQQRIDLYQIAYRQKEIITNPQPGNMYTVVTPVQYNGQKLFLAVSGPLEAEEGYVYEKEGILELIQFMVVFLLLFYLFTAKKMKQFQLLNEGVEEIARGKLSVRLPVRSGDELGTLTKNINGMAGQLEQKMEQERLAEKTKIDLITNISHDLRTPLTSIIGYLTLLQEGIRKDNSLEPYVQSALNKSNQLKKLIDDLFEYTRLTSNQVLLDKQPVDMVNLLKQMTVEFIPLAEKHDISVSSRLPSRKVMLPLDARTFVRAVDNLLMNALKFSVKPGTVRIELFADRSGAVLSIGNEGAEITREQEERLFERFYKGDESRNGHMMPSGAGMGLTIAESIVRLHGGDIWLQRTDRYYRFFIRLPYKQYE